MTDSLLIELGCEELPPKALDTIREAFFTAVCAGLEKNNLAFERSGSRSYSTPRRIALLLADVAPGQPDQVLERRGPAVAAAWDEDGKPTGAALGFARSVGKEVSELETISTDKGEWLFSRVHQAGRPLAEILYEVLGQAVRQLPVPKPMRWADHDFSFVRPVHWLVVMHGSHVIEGQLFGLNAGNTTWGHRIHAPGPHEIGAAERYADVLERAHVLADQDRRRDVIQDALVKCEPDVIIDPDLLNEVNNLVEWPVAISCSFEDEFLEVPHSALVAAMQDHQKFFPVEKGGKKGEVCNRFVAISNIESLDSNQVRMGYERVIRPRLADARFFLEQDLKIPLEHHLKQLDRVVFQQKIGSVGDKSRRIRNIAGKIAEITGSDVSVAERAALLCKCDLMTQMVGEFPELQGEMGGYYAVASGEPAAVSQAIAEHYAPRFAGDAIPGSDAGRIVSLADRAYSLVGIFAAGLKPTGNKDPFALRRAALGLLRILLEAGLDLPPRTILALAADAFEGVVEVSDELLREVETFVADRLRNFYTEKGHGTELVNATLASPWSTLPDLDRRLRALEGFMNEPAAASLAASNKRIGNILRKAEFGGKMEIDDSLFVFDEEKDLFEEINGISEKLEPLTKHGDYASGLRLLAKLESAVDRFFEAVMVMDEDPAKRNNRLALLALLKSRFDRIADLSILG